MIPCAKIFFLLGTILAGSGVAAGAFGAHSLKGMLEPAMLNVFETAVRYQMNHALGLCIVSLTMARYPDQRLAAVGWLFLTGIILFCGSLYTLSLSGIRWVGALTPLGGSAWIVGWGLFAWKLWKARSEEE